MTDKKLKTSSPDDTMFQIFAQNQEGRTQFSRYRYGNRK